MSKCLLPNKCWCPPCRKEYDRKRFLMIRPERVKQIKARAKIIETWYRDLKSKPCTDCGNSYHFAAMQFDHIKDDKEYTVADMVKSGYGKELIQKEIDKCELVCANCHFIRTWNRNHKSE